MENSLFVLRFYGPVNTINVMSTWSINLSTLLLDRLPKQITSEPGHEKMCLMSYANNKGADQPAHPHSLISAFVVRCLDSLIPLDSITEISRL